jgi:homoserine dehydrogenase
MDRKMPRRPIDVAVIGIGLVGSEFLSQLSLLPLGITLVSVSSSKLTHFNPSGISRAEWRAALSSSTTKPSLDGLLSSLKPLVTSGRNVVVVDNTSSEEVAQFYPQLLSNKINVITPNKKAFSSTLELYRNIVAASEQSSAQFLNESTVGAGLPIISTLKDLVATGDKVCSLSSLSCNSPDSE